MDTASPDGGIEHKLCIISPCTSRQHVGAAVVRPNHNIEGDSKFVLQPERISFEILIPKCARDMILLTSTCVQKTVVITIPLFLPRIMWRSFGSLSPVVRPAVTLREIKSKLRWPAVRGCHYRFAIIPRKTPLTSQLNSSGKFSNVSSIIGFNINRGLSVFVTNLKAVQAEGPVRRSNIVSKATVDFRQLCVMIADRVERWHFEQRNCMTNN